MFQKPSQFVVALLGISLPLLTIVSLGDISQASPVNNSQKVVNQKTCPKQSGRAKLVNYFETNNFQIYICRTSKGLFYTGINKKNGLRTAPLRVITEEGTGYVVNTGNITYIVTGASLGIYRNNQLLQEEPVIASQSSN